jgi:hypothetical protein
MRFVLFIGLLSVSPIESSTNCGGWTLSDYSGNYNGIGYQVSSQNPYSLMTNLAACNSLWSALSCQVVFGNDLATSTNLNLLFDCATCVTNFFTPGNSTIDTCLTSCSSDCTVCGSQIMLDLFSQCNIGDPATATSTEPPPDFCTGWTFTSVSFPSGFTTFFADNSSDIVPAIARCHVHGEDVSICSENFAVGSGFAAVGSDSRIDRFACDDCVRDTLLTNLQTVEDCVATCTLQGECEDCNTVVTDLLASNCSIAGLPRIPSTTTSSTTTSPPTRASFQGCSDYTNSSACTSMVGCLWDDLVGCYDNTIGCSAYIEETQCVNDNQCLWDSQEPGCVTIATTTTTTMSSFTGQTAVSFGALFALFLIQA